MFSKDKLPVILFLFLAGVINYLDRSALSIAAPFIQDDLTLSATQMGLIFSSFSIGYAIFNFLGGVASDRYGAKMTLFIAMVVWSLFSGAVALAFGFVSLLIIRILFGMGEGPLSATINKMVNNWFPPTQRASVVGVTNSGTPLGGAISGPIVGMIAVAFSWKVSFVLIMIIGLIWAVLWFKFVKEKPPVAMGDAPAIKAETPPGEKIPLTFYLKQKTVLFTAFAFFAYNYILFFFLTWFPSYLVEERGLSVESMSVITVIPWILGFIGLAAGGFVSDYVYKNNTKRCAVLAQGCACLMFVFISGPDWFGRACDNYCKRCYTCRFISVLSLFDRRYLLGCHSRCG